MGSLIYKMYFPPVSACKDKTIYLSMYIHVDILTFV